MFVQPGGVALTLQASSLVAVTNESIKVTVQRHDIVNKRCHRPSLAGGGQQLHATPCRRPAMFMRSRPFISFKLCSKRSRFTTVDSERTQPAARP